MAFNRTAVFTLLMTFAAMAILSTALKDIPCKTFERLNVPHHQCTFNKTNSRGELERQCVPFYFVCDSIIDCQDASDELVFNATGVNECQAFWRDQCDTDFDGKKTTDGNDLQKFQCNNGQCILGCLRCDGTRDCVDGSDEKITECSGPNQVRPPCN
ncbi:uncharacterized protein [Amphiura filiformis]|uniref:uncharacterized protein n=1 Tax=Amphiura filiformis TaxID=82378 RepID=UPI003B20BD63